MLGRFALTGNRVRVGGGLLLMFALGALHGYLTPAAPPLSPPSYIIDSADVHTYAQPIAMKVGQVVQFDSTKWCDSLSHVMVTADSGGFSAEPGTAQPTPGLFQPAAETPSQVRLRALRPAEVNSNVFCLRNCNPNCYGEEHSTARILKFNVR